MRNGPMKHQQRRDGGQALSEFALVAPLFFLLAFGIIQLGLLFGGQNGLVSATRELARYAAPYHVATAAAEYPGIARWSDSVSCVPRPWLDVEVLQTFVALAAVAT